MRTLLLCIAALLPITAHAQTAQADTPQKPSVLIAPAVDHLSQTVSQIELEHWKSSVRDETDTNLRSIERDLTDTLPALVTAADAHPDSVATTLPLLRNLDALCAVLIRVSVAAHGNASTPQDESIAGSLLALQDARNTLATQAQTLAIAQEAQLAQLRAATATPTLKPLTPTPPPSAPAKHHRTRKTSKTTPATPPTQPQ